MNIARGGSPDLRYPELVGLMSRIPGSVYITCALILRPICSRDIIIVLVFSAMSILYLWQALLN